MSIVPTAGVHPRPDEEPLVSPLPPPAGDQDYIPQLPVTSSWAVVPAEIAMFRISEVLESPAFTDRRSFLALRPDCTSVFRNHRSALTPPPADSLREFGLRALIITECVPESENRGNRQDSPTIRGVEHESLPTRRHQQGKKPQKQRHTDRHKQE